MLRAVDSLDTKQLKFVYNVHHREEGTQISQFAKVVNVIMEKIFDYKFTTQIYEWPLRKN